MKLALLSTAAILFACGGLAMKYSNGMTRAWPTVAFLVLFLGGAACQALAMRTAAMGPVYMFVLGLEAVVAMGLSLAVLGERLTLSRACAVLLIVGGIALLER
jgi:small multidrug resistance pump/quaternary ammonium compound-resistance protein SugE